ncbi:hypothetical protein C3747_1g83 [Trypanosoma cruzi]|uniref:Uncharacterized protein n=2 Tax=Trypanosoma cruzi TaxID=5693 RepID=Q4CW06_TRYCC|nr:hypothetical protein, conserved [Trypanosoma cruzi]EAN84455.1 hypothetical protein, conserved [Trypanosoma cruzi]KAF8298859.1 hypothetical protein TcYC6_0068390 [Trypanosoma cruzi]PWV21867.1 hypothetical protein C3747_1g83 [Trypanosoma cruzi]RNC62140.1 hypothetical protein TcCL_ESM00156 [Trypanosoma cruzi]|eukprot:XP_806306.1 hypothetical protein [Trypanosoma cruzi strain CL Brener]
MRRAFALLRPTAVVRCVQPAAFRPTRVLHIYPQLVRLIVAGGLLVFQAFVVAHNREAQRLREEADGTATGESCSTALMSSSEALHILGMDANLCVPLGEKKDREEATRRFNHLFAIAKNNNNAYLQGKFSAAYRVCVDANWDADENSCSNRGIDSSGTGGEQG